MPKDGLADGVYWQPGNKASGLGTAATTERKFTVVGAVSEDDAILQALASAPAMLGGLVQSDPSCEEICHVTGTYQGTVKWVAPESAEKQQEDQRPPAPMTPVKLGDPVRWKSADNQVQAQIFAIDPADVTSYPPSGANYRDFNGAINVDPETHQVSGCPRDFYQEKWTAEIVVAKSAVDQTFLDDLKALRGTVNDADFTFNAFETAESITWPEKTARFLGRELTEEEEGIRIVFHFLVGENETGIDIGGLTGIDRNAHDYLWVLWETTEDTANNNFLTRKAVQVDVDEIYPAEDWAALEAILA